MAGEATRLRTVIEGVLLATVGFLALQTYNLNGTISEMKGKMDGTSDRLDRIAAVLPGINVRIAQEELRKPVALAVVTTKPTEVSPGHWQTQVHIVDPRRKERSTISREVTGPDDRSVAAIVQGVAADSSVETVSILKVQDITTAAGGALFYVPAGFDPQASFLVTYSYKFKNFNSDSFRLMLQAPAVTWSTEFNAETVGAVGTELANLSAELKAPPVQAPPG